MYKLVLINMIFDPYVPGASISSIGNAEMCIYIVENIDKCISFDYCFALSNKGGVVA